jgi:hypothetical protein
MHTNAATRDKAWTNVSIKKIFEANWQKFGDFGSKYCYFMAKMNHTIDFPKKSSIFSQDIGQKRKKI